MICFTTTIPITINRRNSPQANFPPHKITCSTNPPTIPSDYEAIRRRVAAAIKRACDGGIKLQEVQFPAIASQTAALNQILDANRTHTRVIITRLRGEGKVPPVTALFPDGAEATLAAKVWKEEAPCRIGALNQPPSELQLALCVNPGFNVDEWFALESLNASYVVSLNADLDRIRSGYYPRLFYPRLYETRTRFLTNFEPVFYMKLLADGGILYREYPGIWTLFYRSSNSHSIDDARILWSGDERPEFSAVAKLLKAARVEDQLR